jgi:Spy/CpxP family protein refolding chaperone
MTRWILLAAFAAFLLPRGALPQTHQPYAGLETRSIKSLSDQQIADLRAGRGMGLALAGELNGYPGPVHVLELAEQLGLTSAQRQRTSELIEAMKDETMAIGEQLIAAERELDRLFATKTITETTLTEAVRNAAVIQGSLRAAHLKYHLATLDLLTPDQARRYGELRGYGEDTARPHHH